MKFLNKKFRKKISKKFFFFGFFSIFFRLNAKSKAAGYDTQFGINKFSDLSTAEFHGRLSNVVPSNNTGLPMLNFDKKKPDFRAADMNKTRHKRRSTRYPDYFDLRNEKINGRYIVGPIKDQGQCACCWGFAVTALVETVYAAHSGKFKVKIKQLFEKFE